jgi:peptidoglycan L-alanyl-D-glutamate endopeptidase CwlK
MVSRNPNDLHVPLRERLEIARVKFAEQYPTLPQPFLTCTHRSPDEQIKLVKEGKSKAQPGQSLHNYLPAFAFDIAFKDSKGNVVWDFNLFEKFAAITEALGLEWGGRWPGLVDGPHFQMPMTWQDAKAGRIPILPELRASLEVLVIDGDVQRKSFFASVDGKPLVGRKLEVRSV